MATVIQTLGDAAIAVEHLANHLRLVRAVLERVDPDVEIDVHDLAPLIEDVGRNPSVEYCGPRPLQPVLDACDGVGVSPGAVSVSIGELIALVERALAWCLAIHGALGDPLAPPEPPPA